MSKEKSESPPAEVAHVLFMDIVGFSNLPMAEQRRQFEDLQSIVRDTPEFARGTATRELRCLPTGDGMALVFFRDVAAPLGCALAIARALKSRAYLRVRIGLHSGPVFRVEDINAHANVTGDGINVAQRVMACGDAGHILLSGAFAELLATQREWADELQDLGEHEFRGRRFRLFNLCARNLGNSRRPETLGPATAATAPPVATSVTADPAPTAPPRPPAPEETANDSLPVPPVGALPVDSPIYVERPTDRDFRAAIARRDSIVLVKGARQMGKTSLLARGLQQARVTGARVIWTDFQMLNAGDLESVEQLLQQLGQGIAAQLSLDVFPDDVWKPHCGPNLNFKQYVLKQVLGSAPAPVVWGLDEVDRLLPCAISSDVFGLFRSWHNERALDPGGPWSRLTLAMAYATEAHLFISDIHQSPFNVGTRVTLQDFTPDQVAELNGRYRSPLRDGGEVERCHALLGGHPYLTNHALYEMAKQSIGLARIESEAARDEGIFGEHLRRMRLLLYHNSNLLEGVRSVLRGQPCDPESFYHLRAAGVLTGESSAEARPRCRLYAAYLWTNLL
jgi:class 3 adenylate cyclase